MDTLIKSLSSLRLTVVLFAMAIVIVFAGTLAQIDKGIWTVVDTYFRSPVVLIEFKIFFPRTWSVPGGFYFPGGWLIGFLLMINLFCAHVIRFRITAKGWRLSLGILLLLVGLALLVLTILGVFSNDLAAAHDDPFWRVLWRLGKGCGIALFLLAACRLLFAKRAGLVLIHGGVFLLLVSELVTGLFSVESTMVMKEGETVNFIDHSNAIELAVIDGSAADRDRVTVVPGSMMAEGATIKHADLPFNIRVDRVLPNSTFPQKIAGRPVQNIATAGAGLEYVVMTAREETGVSSAQQKDTPSAYVTIIDKKSGGVINTYLVSLWFYGNHTRREMDIPQRVTVGDKSYDIMLRNQREYLRSKKSQRPFALHLIDFKHDTYIGTNKPSNFSSLVRLVDPDQKIDREVNIWMNNPMRYADLTFYQSSFLEGDSGTVLQVVRNMGWMIPYLACMIVTTGLLVHFMTQLFKFSGRRRDP